MCFVQPFTIQYRANYTGLEAEPVKARITPLLNFKKLGNTFLGQLGMPLLDPLFLNSLAMMDEKMFFCKIMATWNKESKRHCANIQVPPNNNAGYNKSF